MPHHDISATRRIRSALLAGTAALAIVGAAAGAGVLTPDHAAAENVSAKVQPVQAFDFADLVDAVSPAVVSVTVEGKSPEMVSNGGPQGMPDFRDLPEDSPLRKFFKDFEDQFGQDQGRGKPRRAPHQMGQGSGFIISADGYIVTNNHVAGDADKITVTMTDGSEYDAKLIGADDKTDLALVKIDAKKDLPYVEFSDKPARVGQWVVAVGNPFGLGGTVTAGIVSAENRDIGSGPYDDYIQIDAPVNRGNSGGPTFNTEGKVIGVNTAIFSPSGGNVGIAFDIPASIAVPVIQQLKEHGSIARGWLGVQIQPVTDDISESLGLDKPEGAIVSSLLSDSPAGKAGVETGDVVLSVNGKPVKDARDLARKIGTLAPNEDARLTVWRDGDTREITVELGKQPSNKQLAMTTPEDTQPGEVKNDDLGLTFAPAGEDESGVVVTDVDPDGEAARKGLKAGDVIVEAGGSEISNPSDLNKAVDSAEQKGRKAVLLRVKSGDSERFVALSLRKA